MAKDDLVRQLSNDSWNVSSLNNENSYKVRVADSVHAYDLWCTCSGWRFKKGAKDCKHCEAVRQTGQTGKAITKSKPTETEKINVIPKWFNDKLDVEQKEIIESCEYDAEVIILKHGGYPLYADLPNGLKIRIKKYYGHFHNTKGSSKPKPRKVSVKKNNFNKIKVKCWHCNDPDQKIQSEEKAFDCSKCGELLWIGEGGFEEITIGVWR